MEFMDKFAKKATETYKTTTSAAGKFAKEAKLKVIIAENKNKIEDVYEEIGKKVYEAHIREEEINIKELIKEECSKIDSLAKEIEDLRKEILTLKNLKQCQKCSYESEIENIYCPKCGTKLDKNKKKETEEE